MLDHILYPDAQFEGEADVERAVYDGTLLLDVFRARDADEIPPDVWARAVALCCYDAFPIDGSLVARMPACRIIVRAGVGFDHIDLAAWAEAGVPVCNTPDYGTTDVADHALALLLALARGVAAYDERVRRGYWNHLDAPTVRRLTGQTLAIIGLGRIGTAVALRAKALGMDIVCFDPYQPSGIELALGLRRRATLKAALAEADVVSLHTPLTAETYHLMNREAFAHLKPAAILINTARGGVVDLNALADALRDGSLAAAGLDVFESEPLPSGHPLIEAWRAREAWLDGRLLITPHAAFYSPPSLYDLRRKSAETVRLFLADARLRNCVNGVVEAS